MVIQHVGIAGGNATDTVEPSSERIRESCRGGSLSESKHRAEIVDGL